ncbi:MAG: argininosuccinate lyase [Chitinophagaceae bacterium]
MKIWDKGNNESASKWTQEFTVGRDREFDLLLAPYDVQASLAHASMLRQVGLLSEFDFEALENGLNKIAEEIALGTFKIDAECEDVHSQIEQILTERIGDAGKRLHTGRSRNDQVAVDIKLYLRDAICDIKAATAALFEELQKLSELHKEVLIPGYTHMQIGMPSSFGIWFGCWAECLIDDMEMLAAAYAIVNKNPLGSGAGYGSSFLLNRAETTRQLGFRTMDFNVAAAQLSRGRTEKMLAMALSCIASTLGRMATDICLFVGQNFGFLEFPDALTTGSSIMPHKKNPDIFELVRARCNRIQALPNELTILLANMPSGYHRDMQLTKEILFPAIGSLKACLDILGHALPQVKVKEDILDDPKYQYLFSVEAINKLVLNGLSFRDAYKQIGQEIGAGTYSAPGFSMDDHTLEGSMGKLCTQQIRQEWELVMKKFK